MLKTKPQGLRRLRVVCFCSGFNNLEDDRHCERIVREVHLCQVAQAQQKDRRSTRFDCVVESLQD